MMLTELVTELLEGALDVALTTQDLGWARDAGLAAVRDRPNMLVEVGSTSLEVLVTVKGKAFNVHRLWAAVRVPAVAARRDGSDAAEYRKCMSLRITEVLTQKLADRGL